MEGLSLSMEAPLVDMRDNVNKCVLQHIAFPPIVPERLGKSCLPPPIGEKGISELSGISGYKHQSSRKEVFPSWCSVCVHILLSAYEVQWSQRTGLILQLSNHRYSYHANLSKCK